MRQVQWVGDATLTVNDIGSVQIAGSLTDTMPTESDDGLGQWRGTFHATDPFIHRMCGEDVAITAR
jgi:hypothetical protein